MRRYLLQSARGVAATARHDTLTQSSRIPFVCAKCRRVAQQQQPRILSSPARRYLTTTPNRQDQQASATAETQPSQRESIAPQTHYDFFPSTFPSGVPPNSPFTPDLRQLRKEFLQLQAKTHPDLAPPNQKRPAEALSIRVNEAYKTLQDPLRRAQYLLSLRGIDVEDESAKLEESELLMEVMEAREAVEEVEGEEELVGLREENNARIDESVGVLQKAFADGDMDLAAKEAVRLRYWMNIEESIQGWEKGKGGGTIHH